MFTFKTRSQRRIANTVQWILDRGRSADSLSRYGGLELGLYQLQSAADEFAGQIGSNDPTSVMYFMLPIRRWPKLWLVRFIDSFLGTGPQGLTTFQDGATVVYRVGDRDPLQPQRKKSEVTRITRESNGGYTVRFRHGGAQYFPPSQVDHWSIKYE